jgi:flagellar FliL protein
MAKEPEPEAEEQEGADDAPAKGKSKVKLLIIVAAVVLVGGGAAAFLLKDKILSGKRKPPEDAAVDPNAVSAVAMGKILPLETFTVNLAAGSSRQILKITLELEMTDAESVKIAEERMPVIKDKIIMYLSALHDVEVDNDMATIKSDLMRRLGTVVGDRALKGILVTEKLMQ